MALGTHNPHFVAWPLELGLGTLNPRFVAWPLELGLGTLNPRFFAWPLELGLGTLNPRFVAWPLELGLGTLNPRFVAWHLELGLGTLNPRFVAWPLELGLGTHNPRFFARPLELGLGTQAIRGARVTAVQGLMNVMCTQLLHTMHHVILGGWEESLGVEVGSSLIKGSRMKFLRSLIEDVQTRFNGTQWDGSATVEDWVEASSCSCERVFSYVTATDFGQSTERMCETLWVRCKGTRGLGAL